jgi:bud site selection protein 31
MQDHSVNFRKLRHAGDGRFGGPIWWNTPLREDDDEAAEEEHRTQWEQEGVQADSEPMPAGDGASKRSREAAAEEAELPEDVQARLKALRGE